MKKHPDPLDNHHNNSNISFHNDDNDDYLTDYDYPENDHQDEAVITEEAEDETSSTASENDNDKKETTEKKKEASEDQNNSSEHDGKFFVVQKGMACCDKGAKFPNFKVTSHQKHYWNDENGEADYLSVTEDDLTFNPAAMPFGTCSVKNGNPCAFAPAGKWTKTYEKVKIMGKKPLTEISELKCAVGGKITVMKHGQQIEAGKSSVKNADSREQQTYNPIMDFGEFKDETNQSDQLYYE
ncbi:DUF4280 domain-containing protein [Epilithonimonas ginsengisoli]|uniref:DUF4280 domain-containing protein n=1 Tax=Epilithonimonas ginsengisoli TaxID=1245592 RepID=A0ABU4JMB9_9FLAO|nr:MULTISPECIES: DUF4280 domain-containing protein [Chryseobacterium group]MBV6881782.1 DUF4280 domain-containing protein [Epilithonimonas sp. FP105]MDW8550838.1 DUF4280 domain-containing protein [Epilithonimonas ginsengisoli]